jgi:putative ABC transport system ATP-binding protein
MSPPGNVPLAPAHAEYAQGKRVIVAVRDVTREYRTGEEVVRALAGISLDIYAGEYLSIVGPSGSGKSTLFNMVGGLDMPTTGTVTVAGVTINTLSRVEQARLRNRCIGYIFQSYNLIPVMSALQNVALPLLLGGATMDHANRKAKEMLEAVKLDHRLHHRPDQLSGGQQQRVAIARSFANDPEIILADEPTGNLDTKTGEEIIDRLSRLSRERGVTIISATHDHKMLSVSDRVVTIRDGRLDKLELRSELNIKIGSIKADDETPGTPGTPGSSPGNGQGNGTK